MDEETISPVETVEQPKNWADRNPKLSILLIAGVFYLILFGMCGFVVVLLFRG